LIGIDSDPKILEMARARLGTSPEIDLRPGSFLDLDFPPSDLIVASISFHHTPEPASKKRLYERCRGALEAGGPLLIADCFRPSDDHLMEEAMQAWRSHLERYYSPKESVHYLEAWSEEDTYFPLSHDLEWLREAGFQPDVIWRKDLWAVLLCV
jgi:SAM-dependent methyltransferase